MNAEAIAAISAAVTVMVQLAKWMGLPKRWAPFAVLAFSAAGVTLWVVSQGDYARTNLFSYFAGTLAVAMSAIGIYGFATREVPPAPARARRAVARHPEAAAASLGDPEGFSAPLERP